jgi:hypothetical protein
MAAGEGVYFGTVFPLAGGSTQPRFVYERRVARQGDGVLSTHVTRTPAGRIAIVEAASHDVDYQLRQYTLHTDQQGRSGSIGVSGDQLSFELADGVKQRSAHESITEPVVVGPTWVGFIQRRLPQLRAGQVIPVRLALLDRLETLGFELQAQAIAAGQTRVDATPSSWLISLAVDPIEFTFDDASGKLLSFQGRVPPKLWQEGDWADLDARVEYRYVASTYR